MRLFGWLRGSTKSYIASLMSSLTGTVWPTRSFRKLAEEGYKVNPVVFACINEISTAVAAVPWYVCKIQGGQEKRIEGHELLAMLTSPNPEQSGADLTAGEISDYLLAGNSFVFLVGPKGPLEDVTKPMTGKPIGMWQIQPGAISAVKSEKTGRLEAWELAQATPGFNSRIIHPSRIIHRKTYNPLDDVYGMSPLEAAARDVDTMNAGLSYNYGLMKNSGQPAGVILLKGKVVEQQKKKAQSDVDATFNDNEGAGRWKVIEGAEEIDVKPLALSPKDMEFAAGRTASAIGICNVYNVPPEIIGIQGQKTYSNYQEARKAFYQECVLPHLDRIQATRQRRLADLWGQGLLVRYDKADIVAIQEEIGPKFERARSMFQAGIWTANEARAYVGSDPAMDPLADERMVGLSVLPASEAGLPPAEPTEPMPKEDEKPEEEPEDDSKKA